MKLLAIVVLIALGLQFCQKDYCKVKTPKSKHKMLKKLKREYNYKPYKLR